MDIGSERDRRGLSFDRCSAVIIIFVLLLLLAYNYNLLFSMQPAQAAANTGLLSSINESNVILYVIIFIAGALLFVRLNKISLEERIKMNNATMVAILASFFIFASMYYFIAGLHDTIITPQNAAAKSFRQAYGWILQFFVYAAIASVLILLSRLIKKAPDSSYFARTYPHGVLLAIFIVLILFLGAAIAGVAPSTPQNVVLEMSALENIFGVLVFGGLAYFFVWTVETIVRKQELTVEAAAPAVIAMGMLCVLISIISYTAEIVEYAQGVFSITVLAINLVGPAFFGIIGVLLLIISAVVFKSEFMEGQAVYTSLFILGTVYILLAIIQLFLGFDEFITSAAPNFRWIVAVLLFFVPGMLAHVLAPVVRKRGVEYFEKVSKH